MQAFDKNHRFVWTNGCFDVLHIGHIRMLRECAKEAQSHGAKLIVGIDSDARVREMKGDTRPINSQDIRSEFLLAINGVDSVVVFNSSEELDSIISKLQPEAMIVGDDYRNKTVIGSRHAKKVIFFPKVVGYSTTKLLEGGFA